ncbi:hypothetical protein LAV_00030 [Sphingobium phage Lacusarx]|uniref:Uncharacterized protein n=1 Tax=Sphingobium phage Lacusarx TaxID=1980139 RepID=A0A1W6DWP0_9CAUD|nr:hypothetical protein FDH44_gp030 [Sphingobium phage Lacusarx]ARK07430.1 hypothetical protein LAV_00030 [Sphingobium phage Lacusarx]
MGLWSLFQRRPRPKPLRVGDKLPANSTGPYGAFIKVCPCCDRIDEIFIP